MNRRFFCLPLSSCFLILVALIALLGGCSQSHSAKTSATLELKSCRLDGVAVEARCGTLDVFENRETNSGRKIPLNIAVIPSVNASPQPDPIVFFAGGPGQSAVGLAKVAYQVLHKARREREIVLIDQRGTGKSNPLDCDNDKPDTPLAERLAEQDTPRQLKACLAKLQAAPEHYTTPNAVADIEAVRAALGYGQINLWGVSYGTRMEMSYMRAYPQHVRSAVLDSVAPTAIKLPLYTSRDAQASLDRTMRDCAADAACKNFMPDLQRDVLALADKLGKTPQKISLQHPATHEKTDIVVDQRVLANSLRAILYRADYSSLLPITIREAKNGNFGPLLAQSVSFSTQLESNLSVGMYMSVICSEDVPRISEADVQSAVNSPVFKRDQIDTLNKACAVWPKGKIPPSHFEALSSDIPTLIFSGALDPATPPVWGDLVAQTLPRAKHVIAQNLSHSVSQHGCFPKLIADFFKAGNADALKADCVNAIERPAFFTNFAGPAS